MTLCAIKSLLRKKKKLRQHDLIRLAHDYAMANRMKISDSWQKNQAAGKLW
jgi:hypothetical protein